MPAAGADGSAGSVRTATSRLTGSPMTGWFPGFGVMRKCTGITGGIRNAADRVTGQHRVELEQLWAGWDAADERDARELCDRPRLQHDAWELDNRLQLISLRPYGFGLPCLRT